MKKILSLLLSAVIAITAILPITAFAKPINTIQTSESIVLNSPSTTYFEKGYKYYGTGEYDYDFVSQDEKYYSFVAPYTGYFSFVLTGWLPRIDNEIPDAYINVTNTLGQNVNRGGYYNEHFGDIIATAELAQGQLYYIDVMYSPYGTQVYANNNYANVPVTLTVTQHEHSLSATNYPYSIYYECARCGYSYSVESNNNGPSVAIPVSSIVSNTSISKITSGKKKVTVKWKKKVDVSGYQIQYSTKSNFANSKKATVKGNKNTSKTIKGLKSKKKYYFRLRAYKTINGQKYYSSWSKAKAVKVK